MTFISICRLSFTLTLFVCATLVHAQVLTLASQRGYLNDLADRVYNEIQLVTTYDHARGELDSPTITLTNVSQTTLCASNTVNVAFTTSGDAFPANTSFEVWASDATGSFANQRRLGSGFASPVSCTLPNDYTALPYGTNYRFKIVALGANVESGESEPIAIGNLTSARVLDRLADVQQYANTGIICSGSLTTLKVYPTDPNDDSTSPETYQWSLNNSVIYGATSATISAQLTGTYSVVSKQAGCRVTSTGYTLNTSMYPYFTIYSPTLNWEPQCDDHPLSLQSAYIGETATYQWARDGVAIAGATSASFTATQTGTYTYTINDNDCSGTSTPSYFQFGRSLYAVINLFSLYSSQSSDSVFCGGYGGILQTDLSSANGYSVQWYRDGAAIPNATSTKYTVAQPGIYSLLLSQGSCQTFSNAFVIRASDQLKATIISSYRPGPVCLGEKHALIASPSTNASFQWQKDGVDIPGATGATLVPQLTGNYTVRITRGSCFGVSDPVSLTFSNAIQPTIYTSAPGGGACSGMNLLTGGVFYLGYQLQWYVNGIAIDGATGQSYYATQPGAYSVRVTNGTCAGLSKELYVTSGLPGKPVISTSPLANQVCANNSIMLIVYGLNASIQWKRHGVAIPGATINPLFATQSGVYSAVVRNGDCQVESDPITIKIGEPTTATLNGKALVSAGQATYLPVTFTGQAPWSFTLNTGQSVMATYQNPTLIPVSPTSTTTYQLASVATGCGLGTTSGEAVVTVGSGSADVSLNMAVSNRAPKINELVDITLTLTNAGPQAAVGVQAQSRLPAGMVIVESSSPGVSAADGVVTINVVQVGVGEVTTFHFQVKVVQPGVYFTSAQLTASQTPDPDSQPDSGTGDGQDDAFQLDLRTRDAGGPVTISANPGQTPLPQPVANQPLADPTTADLSLSLTTNILTPRADDIITATLTISNRGGSSASAIKVQTQLSSGWTLVDSTGLIVDGQLVTGYVNQLAAGQSDTIVLSIRVSQRAGQLQAQIMDMAETDPDSVPGNDFGNGEDDEATLQIQVR